jgi:signal transduction histidine kinase
MLRLIDDRMEELRGLHLQPTDLISLVRRQLALAVPQAERKGLKLALIIQGDVPLILVDTPKISLVFDRLMRNAIQSARPDSRLRIQVELKNQRIILSVRAGAQKPMKKGRKPGSVEEAAGGKGFAVITRIIEGHGGHFKLSDKLGKGSMLITVTLPVTPGPTDG